MELLSKLERTIAGWLKDVPHLPSNVRKWLGDNAWWIALGGAIILGISALALFSSLFATIATLSSPVLSYYASTTFLGWVIVTTVVSLVFFAIEAALLALSVNALKLKQKKGWVLLFAAWLVSVVFTVVNAFLTFNAFSVITSLMFGAVWAAIGAYFLYEIHSEFAHTEKSAGVKRKKAAVPPLPKA